MANAPARLTALICGICLIAVVVPAQRSNGGPKVDPTVSDFAYGDHERHVLDFYRADSSSPTPLVVYIHGGGFTRNCCCLVCSKHFGS